MTTSTADQDTWVAMTKVLIAWVGALLGGISLSTLVLTSTLGYTLLQSFILLRKMWRRQA